MAEEYFGFKGLDYYKRIYVEKYTPFRFIKSCYLSPAMLNSFPQVVKAGDDGMFLHDHRINHFRSRNEIIICLN